jgi:hypothetical protein
MAKIGRGIRRIRDGGARRENVGAEDGHAPGIPALRTGVVEKKEPPLPAAQSLNREASNRVDRSHSMSRRWTHE